MAIKPFYIDHKIMQKIQFKKTLQSYHDNVEDNIA